MPSTTGRALGAGLVAGLGVAVAAVGFASVLQLHLDGDFSFTYGSLAPELFALSWVVVGTAVAVAGGTHAVAAAFAQSKR